ncbi:MAG: PAS domain-containing protein [Kineosporiaceae bacterium]
MTATREPTGAPAGTPDTWDGAEVVVVDTDGVIVAVNDEWLDFCHRNGGDPLRCGVGTSYLAACEAAAGDPVADAVAAVLRAALDGRRTGPQRVTVPCHTPTTRRWYDVHVLPHRGDLGEPTGASIAVLPVLAPSDPESSAAAAGLGLPYGDLLDVLDLVPDPVLVLDRRLRVVHANLGAARWLEYAPDHLVGKPLGDLGSPSGTGPDPQGPDVEHAIRDAPDGSLVQRWVFRSRAGEARTAEAHLHLSGAPGDRVRVVLVARDVGEREALDRLRRRQAALATRERAARQRLAVLQDRQRIARDLHDTVIQDLIGLGMHLHAEAGHEPDAARRARDSELVDQLDRVVRRLRAEVFQLRDNPPGVSVAESVESLVAEAARVLGHVPALSLTGPVDDLPPALAREVTPVLREALSNVTRHATARVSWVTVAVAGGVLRLEVEDDGRGPPRRGARGGTGLANLRDRAAALGGDAGLEPRPEGGSRLWWQCPLNGAPHRRRREEADSGGG